MKFQLKICNSLVQNKLKVLKWCAYDPDFKPNQMDGEFRTWVAKGITTFYSITDRGKLKEFQTLQEIHGLEKHDFYRYL